MNDHSDFSPFSEPVNVRKLSKKGTILNFEAPPKVRGSIASEYELLSVESFEASALITPWKKDGVKISGKIRARIVQPCAITLEPLDVLVDEEIDVLLVPVGSKLAVPQLDGEGEIIVEPDGPDLPETFTGDTIDLAEIWMEFFALGIDPFAHREGATLPAQATSDADDASESPFAALEAMRKK